jgi:hypothetical protein
MQAVLESVLGKGLLRRRGLTLEALLEARSDATRRGETRALVSRFWALTRLKRPSCCHAAPLSHTSAGAWH